MTGRPRRGMGTGEKATAVAKGAGFPRPPFAKGNALGVKGGGRSPRVYGALAETLAAGLIEDRPDLAEYPEAVAAWATAEAKAALFRRQIDKVTPFYDDGEPRKNLLHYAQVAENAALKHRDVLGLDPRSEAALARERASATALGVDLAILAERGQAVLDARAAAGIAPPPDIAGQVLRQVQLEGHQAMTAAAEKNGYPLPRNPITDDDDQPTEETP